MSKIADVSNKLGEYLLKGWVMTDTNCPQPGCNVPLMRSPAGRTPVVQFCANCDGDPSGRDLSSVNPTSNTLAQSSPSHSSSSHVSHISRSSTPPTEVSSTLSSPTFAPPVDNEETLRRRQQSDRASAEIGKRLLKGWAMLADECPNSRCYGVPLVRPPKAGGGKDIRKECVICGSVFVSELDASGWERLVPYQEDVFRPQEGGSSSSGISGSTLTRDKGKSTARDETPQNVLPGLPSQSSSHSDTLKPTPALMGLTFPSPTKDTDLTSVARLRASNTASALEVSARSLELTLHTLSERMTYLSSGQLSMDPTSIASTADAIYKVTQALTQVKQLQWSESQAAI